MDYEIKPVEKDKTPEQERNFVKEAVVFIPLFLGAIWVCSKLFPEKDE